MAKKPAQDQVEFVEDLGEHTPADDDLVTTEDNILAAVDATDKNVTWDIRIYKLDKSAGNAEEYMFSVLPGEMDGLYDRIRDSEGTGTYRLKAYRQLGAGRKVVFKAKDFRIRATAVKAAPQQDNRPTEMMTAVLAAMKEQNDRNERLLRELLTAKPTPQETRNPFDDLEKLTTVMKNLMPAAPAAVAAQAPADLTGVFVKGVEFAEKIVGDRAGGGDDGDVGIWGMAKEVIKNLPQLAAIAQAQQPQQPQRPRPGTRQAQVTRQAPPLPPQQPQAPAQQPQANDVQAEMKEVLEYLITRAQRNSDALFYADWLMENVERSTITLLLSQPDPVGTAIMLDARVGAHRDWFDRFIAELRELVNSGQATVGQEFPNATRQAAPPHVPNVDPRGTGRNGSDAANHVPRGQGWQKTTDHP